MLHYVLAGGCGFLGFHLARRLLSNGHRVTAVDVLRCPQSLHNADQLRDWALFRLVRHDATQPLSEALRMPRPWDVDRAIVTCQRPTAVTSRVLDWAVDPPMSWTRPAERWRPPRVLTVADERGRGLPRSAGCEVRLVSLADAYGPRMERHHWLWDSLCRLAEGERVTTRRDTMRATIHVEDAATAIYKAVNIGTAPTRMRLGGSEHWTERALVEAFASRLDVRPRITERKRKPSVSPGGDDYNLFGWRPSARLQPSFHELQAWRVQRVDVLAQRYDID